MTDFDDVAGRAGADVRARYDGAPAPELRGRRPASSRRALVIGLAVVLVATGVVAVVRSARPPVRAAAPVGQNGPMWQRISYDRAFGESATVRSVVAGSSGFLAVGGLAHRCPAFASTSACEFTAAWTSEDGAHWTPVAKVPFRAPSAVAANGDTFVLIDSAEGQDYRIWSSTNGRDWTVRAHLHIGASSWGLGTVGRGFVAIHNGAGPNTAEKGPPHITWQSSDGGHWRRVAPRAGQQTGVFPAARLGTRYLGLGTPATNDPIPNILARDLRTSTDGLHWSQIRTDHLPRTMHGDHAGSRVLGLQPSVSPSGLLTSTTSGSRWTEVASFGERFPTAKPGDLVQSGTWWVLSGNFRATSWGVRLQVESQFAPTMWASPDLEHWIEMPGPLRGHAALGRGVMLAAHHDRVVGVSDETRSLWVWTRPSHAPHLVRVSGTWRGVDGDAPGLRRPMLGRVDVKRGGRIVDSAQTNTAGQYTVDLEPGSYVLHWPCGRTTVHVVRQEIRRDVLCQMK